ncbi:MAG: hypothetical protein Q9184_008011 [Pyrenodesmia sp. 2 TL-2023]
MQYLQNPHLLVYEAEEDLQASYANRFLYRRLPTNGKCRSPRQNYLWSCNLAITANAPPPPFSLSQVPRDVSTEAEVATKRKPEEISDNSTDDERLGSRRKRRRKAPGFSSPVSNEEDENAAKGRGSKPAGSQQDLPSENYDLSAPLLQPDSSSKPPNPNPPARASD